MTSKLRILRSLAVATCVALPALACDGYSYSAGTRSNVTAIYLTDAPFPYIWIESVDIFVVSVAVSTSADTSVAANFHTVATPNRRINLLALNNGIAQLIGTGVVPSGPVTAVRMVIDTDSSSMTTVNGFVITSKTFSPSIQWQSSSGRPVLHALVHEQITVPDTGAVIVLDFDVGKSFILNRDLDPGSLDSGFVFSPVIRAVDAQRAGEIRGRVRAVSSGGEPVRDVAMRLYLGDPAQPENTWSLMGTAGSNPLGDFAFSFVTRTAYWESVPAQAGKTYIVVAEPHGGSTLNRAVLSNISVTAGVETNVGTMVLPLR